MLSRGSMAFTVGELIKVEPLLLDGDDLDENGKYILNVRLLKGEVDKFTLNIENNEKYKLLCNMIGKKISFYFNWDRKDNEITKLCTKL